MRIAILGTGMVGRTLAARVGGLGHQVVVGTRDVDATMSRTESDAMGNPPFALWQAEHPEVGLMTLASAAAQAELVINATSGTGTIGALTEAGADNLAGKVLVDIANPLDFSAGMPPTLFVKDTDSLAEQVQRAFPATRVVKTLNTMNASLMVNPVGLAAGEHTVFVSGNDEAAKRTVSELLREFGWADIIDVGDISTARATEMLLPIWLRLMGVFQHPHFSLKVVR